MSKTFMFDLLDLKKKPSKIINFTYSIEFPFNLLNFYFSGLNIEFINRVCEVGVDINQCVAHNHMSNMVQFVAGLGPRKGNYSLNVIPSSSKWIS